MLTALTPVLYTILHRFTFLLCIALCSYNLPSLCFTTCRSAILNTLPCHDMSVPVCLNAGLISHVFFFSNIRFCRSQSSESIWLSVSFSQRHWHTSSLNIRGFVGHYTTRCCCPLLRYNSTGTYLPDCIASHPRRLM